MGVLLLFNGGLMLFSSLTSFLTQDGFTFEITLSAFLVLSFGALLMLITRQYNNQIQKRHLFSLGSYTGVPGTRVPSTGSFHEDLLSMYFIINKIKEVSTGVGKDCSKTAL